MSKWPRGIGCGHGDPATTGMTSPVGISATRVVTVLGWLPVVPCDLLDHVARGTHEKSVHNADTPDHHSNSLSGGHYYASSHKRTEGSPVSRPRFASVLSVSELFPVERRGGPSCPSESILLDCVLYCM